MSTTQKVVFELPWIPTAKKSQYGARAVRAGVRSFAVVYLKATAKREQQAIHDVARAWLAHAAGAIDAREYSEFVADALRFKSGLIKPKPWSLRCEPFARYSLGQRDPVKVTVEIFRDKGGATSGTTRVTIETLPWEVEGDVRKLTDLDGTVTTVLDSLQGVFYGNDRQVEELHALRYRVDHVYEHGSSPEVLPL